eukprot:310004_1
MHVNNISKSCAPTSTSVVAVVLNESSSDEAVNNTTRYPIDHYASQYRVNQNAKNRRKQSHTHNHECKTNECDTNNIEKLMKEHEIKRTRRYGKFFAVFVPLLFTIYTYYSFMYIIPNLPFLIIFQNHTDKQHLILFRTLFTTFSIVLVFLWYWAYFKSKYSHPGPIPKAWTMWNGNPLIRPSDPIYAIDTSLHGSTMIVTKHSKLYCVKCKIFRPNRTGHCKRCNICVTRIDHHCTFLNNCIGSNNQRYFCQFLIYSAIAWILYVCFTPFSKRNIIHNVFNDNKYNLTIFIIFTFLPILAVFGLFFISFLILGQFQSIARNQTFAEVKFHNERIIGNNKIDTQTSCWKRIKIQFDKGRNKWKETVKNVEEIAKLLDENEREQKDESEEIVIINEKSKLKRYDLGSIWRNMETVFGSSIIYWFIPLDWNEDELYKRMLTHSFSFDLMPKLPCNTKKSNDIMKSIVANID